VEARVNEAAVTWLREQVQTRLDKAQLRGPSPWKHGPSTEGRLLAGEDVFDSSGAAVAIVRGSYLAAHMAANDPLDVIAQCEAELAILDAHGKPRHYCPLPVLNSEHGQLWTPEEGPCWTIRLVAGGYRHCPGSATHWPLVAG
jgi:hypothetical protein